MTRLAFLLVFLLGGCGFFETPRPSPRPDTPAPKPCEKSKIDWKNHVENIITGNCTQSGCHPAYADYQIAKSKIDGIILRTGNRSMPTPPRKLDQAEIDLIKAWKDNGTPLECGTPTPPPPGFITNEYKESVKLSALFKIELNVDKANTRWVNLCHIYNLGVKDLNLYRVGVSKLLNSLSDQSDLKSPIWEGEGQCLGRIDQRWYGWNAQDWENIIAANTVNIVSRSDEGVFISQLTETQIPEVNGDWLAFYASQPPIYDGLLDIPATVAQLEAQLPLNKAQAFADREVQCAGVTDSFVTKQNRLLCRFPIDQRPGFYRRSFDFLAVDAANPERNLRAFPGKEEFGFTQSFQEAGGEIIFPLFNGFQGYVIIDAAGNVIPEAPFNVVFDPIHAEAVVAGRNCISCHHQGSKEAKDIIRNHISLNEANYDPGDVRLSYDLYVPHADYANGVSIDRRIFCQAMAEIGGSCDSEEPIGKMHYEYDSTVCIDRASVEAGVQKPDLLRCLRNDNELQANLSGLTDGGCVERPLWETQFARVVEACRILDADD